MLDKIKIAFFDLDGTLTNDKKLISNNTYEALKKLKEKNIKIVFSSGRWDSYMLDYDSNLEIVDYLICNNGAQVYDVKNNCVIREDILKEEMILDIKKYCLSKNIKVIFNGLFKQFINDEPINTNIYQAIIICSKLVQVDNLIEFAKDKSFKITYISLAYYKKEENRNYSINFNTITTDKGNSIKYLLDYLNIKKHESICFGDNHNDISMFNNCGIKVAMDNGLKELKDMADYVTISNDEDGVAYFINNYM